AILKSLLRAAWTVRVRVVDLPGVPEKGDVSDWFANGGNADALRDLIAATPLVTPKDALAALDDSESEVDGGANDDDEQERLQRAVLSEDHLAQRFTMLHGTLYRFCAQTARWYRYVGGTHYEEDSTLGIFDEVRR